MKFEKYGFDSRLEKNIFALGFKRPTDIQYKAISPVLKGDDVLAVAQTGTGKTAAFVIPIVQILLQSGGLRKTGGIRCLVMVPTRELAEQIKGVFVELCRETKLKTVAVFGGVEEKKQIDELNSGADILIATPGRMFDLKSRGFITFEFVKILVLDEADRMLDNGFIKDIRDTVRHLPKKRQTLFFSATIDKNIKELAYSLVYKPVRIQISPKDPVSKNVNHSVLFVNQDDKRFFLERIIKENPNAKILVFVRTKVRAERVKKAMERVEIPSETIHGDKEQKTRFDVLNKFRDSDIKLLIATDVSARGIDIAGIDFVINYDLPELAENYVHRIGRTGRGVNKGNAVSFCAEEEKELLGEIEEYLGLPIHQIEMPAVEYQKTIDFSEQAEADWKTLMREDEKKEKAEAMKKKRKK